MARGRPQQVWATVGAFAVAFIVEFSSDLAVAANGNMPRTPALYPHHACLTVVDRSVASDFTFAVHIPFEDTMISEDELPDSRQFSFFGLCRDPGRLELLPNWISTDDADRALEAAIIDTLPPADDILLEDPAWNQGHDGADTCVQGILEERLPISCAATADGVAWDTTGVPAGNYVIRGYTFAPPAGLWTTRIGVVQVNDGELLPVATLVSPVYDAKAFLQAGYRVLGCMAGPPGTMVSLQWASTATDNLADDAAWTEFAALDAAQGAIDELLLMPEQTVYLGLFLRAVASGPDGSRWVGHAPGFVTVYPGDGESDVPEVPPPPDHCDAGGDTSGGADPSTGDPGSGDPSADATSSAADETSSAGAGHDGGGGCACSTNRGDANPPLWWLGLAVAGHRLRRSRAR